MGRRFVTIRERNEMRRRRTAGETVKQIAADFGIAYATAYRHTKDVPPPPGKADWRFKWSAPRILPSYDELRRMRTSLRLREIAALYNVSDAAVCMALKRGAARAQ